MALVLVLVVVNVVVAVIIIAGIVDKRLPIVVFLPFPLTLELVASDAVSELDGSIRVFLQSFMLNRSHCTFNFMFLLDL